MSWKGCDAEAPHSIAVISLVVFHLANDELDNFTEAICGGYKKPSQKKASRNLFHLVEPRTKKRFFLAIINLTLVTMANAEVLALSLPEPFIVKIGQNITFEATTR